jgi:hypothetical protein
LQTILELCAEQAWSYVVVCIVQAQNMADSGGNDVFGISKAFRRKLRKQRGVSVEDFRSSLKVPAYRDELPFKPSKSKYFDKFQQNVLFELDKEEKKRFEKNGFVVSERLGAESFAEIYYRIYATDMPVFITADSMLHAFHWSFDRILKELESQHIYNLLDVILRGIDDNLVQARKKYGSAAFLGAAFDDIDFFVTVARNLLQVNPTEDCDEYGAVRYKSRGAKAPSVLKSRFKQDEKVEEALKAVSETSMKTFQLFGSSRQIDFSQFIPRGNYTKTAKLKSYFRTMMWLAKIDFRVAGGSGGSSPSYSWWTDTGE